MREKNASEDNKMSYFSVLKLISLIIFHFYEKHVLCEQVKQEEIKHFSYINFSLLMSRYS